MTRPSARTIAIGLGVLMVLLVAASVPLNVLAHNSLLGGSLGIALLFSPFAVVGVLVASRQPRNPIGWTLLVLAISMIGSVDAGAYSVVAFRLGHPGLPLARLAVALTQSWIGLILLLPLPIVLFPDGHLPSRRWRWTFWLYLLLAVFFVSDVAYRDVGAFTDRVVRVDSSGELQTFAGPSGPAAAVLAVLYALVVVSWVVGKVVEYRRSTGEHRQQLKWLMLGGAVSIVALLVTLSVNGSIAFIGVAALPISIGVGILQVSAVRHRPADPPSAYHTRSSPALWSWCFSAWVRADHRRVAVLLAGRGRGIDARGRRVVQSAAPPRPAHRRPPVQPRPGTTPRPRSRHSGSASATRSISRPSRPA